MKADVQYFENANWASLTGSFTPDELREVAQEIEKKHAGFQASQSQKENAPAKEHANEKG